MVFIETPVFTARIKELLNDEEYMDLQKYLARVPKAGAVIPGGRGLRKLRWSEGNKGKRGGLRVIYYFYDSKRQIYMIYPFRKSDQADLTKEQLRLLAAYVKEGVL